VVVAAVRDGLLSLEESCERYKLRLSVDQFLSWQRSIERDGLPEIARYQHPRLPPLDTQDQDAATLIGGRASLFARTLAKTLYPPALYGSVRINAMWDQSRRARVARD
jgi:hypothetical protein